jgi:hypothetical protein
MGDTLHTYHPTTTPGRGIHAITTTDHEEAFTMLQAARLKTALADLLAWEGTILEAVEQVHGQHSSYRELCTTIQEAGKALAGETVRKI